jgi:putative ABC transport system permease protein
MSWLDGLRHRIRSVLRPGDYEREIEEEMTVHRQLMTVNDDSRFGNQTYHKEEARRMTWLSWFDLLRQDIGYAWRSIRRTRGVTAMIVITLALGIGVNAATFSVLDQLFLRAPSGVVDPGGIRRIWNKNTRTAGPHFFSPAVAYPQYKVLAEQWGGEDRMAVMLLHGGMRLGGTLAGASTDVLFTSANYFTLLGIRPAMGRFYTDAEARPGTATRQLVVSHKYWKTHLGADEQIIGKRIKLDTLEWEVLGVAQPGFDGIDLRATATWAPLGSILGADRPHAEAPTLWDSPRYLSFWTFGRVGDGQNLADFERRATTAMREANRRFYPAYPDTLMTVHAASIIEARGPATAKQEEIIATRLQGVALIVLIIACANVVNLLLARAVGRRREIAVRLALGISRTRLIRLITIEAVLLASVAAVAALLTAWWGGSLLRSQLMVGVVFAQPALHAHVIWATLAVALGCGVIAGVIPAVQFSRPQLTNDLKDGGRTGGRQRSQLRDGLVIAQAALSVMLLVGATLFVRTLQNIEGIDIGFDTGRTIFANMSYDPGKAPPMAERLAKIAEVEERLQGRTGIEVVGRSAIQPMGGFSFWSFWWDADSSWSLTRAQPVGYVVGSKYFVASGLRILSGRTFGDGADGEGQVVVNEAFAKLLWPGQRAEGQCLRFEKRDAPCHTVTGVVTTAARSALIERPQPQYYMPIQTKLTERMGGTILVVRTLHGAEAAAVREVTAMLKQALPMGYPVIRTMEEIVEPKYRPWRLGAKLFTGVGVLALLVALVGIYSTVAYSVGQRTHEFGVRAALGARIGDVLNQVVGEGLRVVLIGIGLGIALTFAASRLVTSLLYGVEPNDTSAMLLAGSTLLSVAIIAAIIPAWRAARVDPVTALRGD